ncbi:hypothetical protein [Noviherbaspirillum suwonense]|jgi:hypothetical protein|uniref:Uncharacterized protein n=1 Tax=Noviherbaspirillum suwonense TaxID=1224511 RepID=A0ABY1QHV9_9BURK|nr:hypothetical protein [Noviherbaspirillum suwonense]SMP71987.1 hypothetical protein SAMN06295970_117107 [Noviherbaspirillum suwonense]
MAILTFPSIIPTRATWGLKSITEAFTSPLNGTTQTSGRPGSRWKVTLEFESMNLSQGATLDGWLAGMDGMSNRTNIYPHHRPGTGATATVNGASQVGSTLNINCAANRVFAAGDFFSVNGELKMITASTVANGTGQATLAFSPMLRASPTSGSNVVFTQPTVQMMLAQDEYGVTRVPGPLYENITISMMEVFQ